MNEEINDKYPVIPTIVRKLSKRITLLREMVKVIVDKIKDKLVKQIIMNKNKE